MISASNVFYNTLLFYMIIVTILLILKPEFMYSEKQKKFKSFGMGKGKTLFCLPIISIGSAIILYFLFFFIEISYNS